MGDRKAIDQSVGYNLRGPGISCHRESTLNDAGHLRELVFVSYMAKLEEVRSCNAARRGCGKRRWSKEERHCSDKTKAKLVHCRNPGLRSTGRTENGFGMNTELVDLKTKADHR